MKALKQIGRFLVATIRYLLALADYLIEILEEMGSPKRRRPRR